MSCLPSAPLLPGSSGGRRRPGLRLLRARPLTARSERHGAGQRHCLNPTSAASAAEGARPPPRPPAYLRTLLTAATAFWRGGCFRSICLVRVNSGHKLRWWVQRLGSPPSSAARARVLHQQGAAAAAGVGGGLGPEQRHVRPWPAHPRRRRLPRRRPPQPCRFRNCSRRWRLQVCPHLHSHEIACCLPRLYTNRLFHIL